MLIADFLFFADGADEWDATQTINPLNPQKESH